MEETQGSMNEESAGITEYLSAGIPGFHGILKHRYSDFHVNEMDLDGKVVRFTGSTATKVDPPSQNGSDEARPSEKESIRIDVTSRDKDTRRQYHELVKKHFPNLNSDTESEDEKKFIAVSYIQTKSRRDEWPSHRPKFLHFTLHKANIDTFAALSLLSKRLNKKPGQLCFAGTKDKRAVTTQRISIKYVSAEMLSRASKLLCKSNIVTGDYSYKDDGLRLGDLSGNHFKIVLRNIDKPLEEILPALESLKNVGFINYFGLQRFGTSKIPTSTVGLKAIKQDWEGVVNLILKTRPNDVDYMNTARKIWEETKDPKKAMKPLFQKGKATVEFAVLKGLSRNDKDFVGALNFLGRSTKSLYTHSYQSLIWNEMVSKRIREYGTKVIIGDLVQCGEPQRHNTKRSAKQDSDDTNEEKKEDEIDFHSHIKTIDESNLKDFTIYDVVMPQPGHDIHLPNNEIKSWYEERLAQDNLKFEDLKNSVKDFDLVGSYRKVIVKPTQVKWSTMRYSSHTSNLTLSDNDVVLKKTAIVDEGEAGKFHALILELSLPTCSYATMALREITKEDTSVSVQAGLTNNINGKREAEESIDEIKNGEAKQIKMDNNDTPVTIVE